MRTWSSTSTPHLGQQMKRWLPSGDGVGTSRGGRQRSSLEGKWKQGVRIPCAKKSDVCRACPSDTGAAETIRGQVTRAMLWKDTRSTWMRRGGWLLSVQWRQEARGGVCGHDEGWGRGRWPSCLHSGRRLLDILFWNLPLVRSRSVLRLFVTPWTVTHQAPLSMGFPRQECWSGLPFLLQGILCISCIVRWVPYHRATREAYHPYPRLIFSREMEFQADYTSFDDSKWLKGALRRGYELRVVTSAKPPEFKNFQSRFGHLTSSKV